MQSDYLNKQQFIPTRTAGEEALKVFAPKMGKRYTNGRNFDRGMGKHRDVSMLSPYLRRRLVLEQDVVATAVQTHGAEGAEKFIQEVVWRAYFKGWLEHRPVIWDLYKQGLARDLAALDRDRGLRKRIEAAETGQTGLDYFDSWAKELVETGYLHNHARMWFASIWIFSLELPWRLGADFFFRHLLDGDPASNTLGWRWVGGLHTRGKPIMHRLGISPSLPITVSTRAPLISQKSLKVWKAKNLTACPAYLHRGCRITPILAAQLFCWSLKKIAAPKTSTCPV